jgi:hypothetical protein
VVVTVPAHLVATPVLERLTGGSPGVSEGTNGEREGTVLGVADTAVWIDLSGFVVVVTTREVPLLPNAIALSVGAGALGRAAVGSRGTARFIPGRVALGSLRITWNPTAPPSWDPTVPVPTDATPAAVAARGAAFLRALGSRPSPQDEVAEGAVDNHGNPIRRSATLPYRGPRHPGAADSAALVRELARVGLATAADPEGAAGLTLLFRAVRERDPEPAAAAGRALLGRGPGLTPEGDDLLAAVAGTLAVLGPAGGLPEPGPTTPPEEPTERTPLHEPTPCALIHEPTPSALLDEPTLEAMLAALAPIPGRTTALSSTLLTLASERRLPEPAGRLLDLGSAGETAWPAALARLERLGHGSGRAYAAGIAATAMLLAAPEGGVTSLLAGPHR